MAVLDISGEAREKQNRYALSGHTSVQEVNWLWITFFF